MARRNKPDPYLYEAMTNNPKGIGIDTACGKKGYASSVDADRVREHRQLESGDTIDIYSCDQCGKWHLTSRTW